jgi:hypothetical protein
MAFVLHTSGIPFSTRQPSSIVRASGRGMNSLAVTDTICAAGVHDQIRSPQLRPILRFQAYLPSVRGSSSELPARRRRAATVVLAKPRRLPRLIS